MSHNYQVVYGEISRRLSGKDYFSDIRACLDSGEGASYQADGIHLTDPGRRKVAKTMSRIILAHTGIAEP